MPQLDSLILWTTCVENTIYFWLLYFLIINVLLSKINNIFLIRKNIKQYLFLNDIFILKEYYYKNSIFLRKLINIGYYKFNNNFKELLLSKSLIILIITNNSLFNNFKYNHNLYGNYNLVYNFLYKIIRN